MTNDEWYTIEDATSEPIDVIIDEDGVHISQDNLDGDADSVSLSWQQMTLLTVIITQVLKADKYVVH